MKYVLVEKNGETYALFEMEMMKNQQVKLGVKKSGYIKKNGYADDVTLMFIDVRKLLLYVDDRILELVHDIKNHTEENWRSISKLPNVKLEFNIGKKMYVPLPLYACEVENKRKAIYKSNYYFFKKIIGYKEIKVNKFYISNGYTRTSWLIGNGIKIIPVLGNERSETDWIQSKMGDEELGLIYVNDLFNEESVVYKKCCINKTHLKDG